jgi:hypothetical protein
MNAVADGDPVAAALPAVERALSEGATIAISGLILDDVWRHALDRRTFAIGEVDGDIDTITVECNRRTAELEYSEDAEWSLPESWGACSVAVEGRDDTAFKFFEFQ